MQTTKFRYLKLESDQFSRLYGTCLLISDGCGKSLNWDDAEVADGSGVALSSQNWWQLTQTLSTSLRHLNSAGLYRL